MLLYFCYQHETETKKLMLSSDILYNIFKYTNVVSLASLSIYSLIKRVTRKQIKVKEEQQVRKSKRA